MPPTCAKPANGSGAACAAAGMENVEMMETGGHPVVYADWLHAPGKPTVMIYGHFDTQPVDPLELWDSPPFEPVVKDGRVYARGASDDKGNMLAPILALEALLQDDGRAAGQRQVLLRRAGRDRQPDAARLHCGQQGEVRLRFRHQRRRRPVERGSAGAARRPSRGCAACRSTWSARPMTFIPACYGGAIQNPIHALVGHHRLHARRRRPHPGRGLLRRRAPA